MSNITVYHGSRSVFERPSHEFLGEGMTHSENGYGFYVTNDMSTAGEHAGSSFQDGGIMYSYQLDEEMVDKSFLVSDQAIGQEKYQALVEAVQSTAKGPEDLKDLDRLSPDMTGKEAFGLLKGGYFSNDINPTTRAGAERLSESGIKGVWYKGEEAICIFDLDDVPESRIERVGRNFPEGQAALEQQQLGDLKTKLASGSPEFKEAFEAYAEKTGFDINTAESITELPNHDNIMRAIGEHGSPGQFEFGLPNLTDPEQRQLWGELHDATFPDAETMDVKSVPADQIDGLSLREKVEFGYAENSSLTAALKDVYATGDEALIEAVEGYANTVDVSPGSAFDHNANYIANRIRNALDYENRTSNPRYDPTPDKMASNLDGLNTTLWRDQDAEARLHAENIREAIRDYGERVLDMPSEVRIAAREAEALANARNNPAELMANGKYFSESLSTAAWRVGDAGNPALQESFDAVASTLISDEYNGRGLPNQSHGAHIDNGYTLRSSLGNAVNRMMIDGGESNPDVWADQKRQLLEIAGDDPKLVSQVEALEKSLFDHVEQTHGKRPSVPDIPNPHAKATSEIAEEAGIASKFAKAARGGSHIPVIGAAAGIGGAVLSNQAHAAQQGYAEQLHADGVLSDEALQEYNRINAKYDQLFMADAGAGTAAEFVPVIGQIAAAAGSISIESGARTEFKEWADKYAPNLSEEQYQTLSMSIVPGQSSRTEMLMSAMGSLPDSKEGQPDFMHEAIDAKNAYMKANNELANTPIGPGPRHAELSQTVGEMKQDLLAKVEQLMSHPDGMNEILNATPIEDRMEYARRLAASDPDAAALENNHTQIADYAKTYDESWTGMDMFMSEDNVLRENPDLLNAYIMERSGIEMPSPETHDPIIVQNLSMPDAKYAGDPALLQEFAGEDGADINAALIADAAGPSESPQLHGKMDHTGFRI